MKRLIAGFLVTAASLVWGAVPETDILRIRIEWLNAKECGIEGCKPQSVVLRSGSSMTFGWTDQPERGVFEVGAQKLKDTIEVTVKRTMEAKGDRTASMTTETLKLPLDAPQEMKIDELRWMLTASKYVAPEKK